LLITSAIVIATAFFVYVFLSTKFTHVTFKGIDKLKYELNKYHAERYWAIFVGALLIWFWFLGYPWTPPVAFNSALHQAQEVHTVKVTAGQWYWMLEDGGISKSTVFRNIFKRTKKISGTINIETGQTRRLNILITCWKGVIRTIFTTTRNVIIPLVAAITLVFVWHVPFIFDISLFNENIHIIQHLSFVIVGALFFLSSRQLGESFPLYLLISSVGMMVLSGLILAITHKRIYLPYTISSHNLAGTYMLGTSIVTALIALPFYLVRRTFLYVSAITKRS